MPNIQVCQLLNRICIDERFLSPLRKKMKKGDMTLLFKVAKSCSESGYLPKSPTIVTLALRYVLSLFPFSSLPLTVINAKL